MMFKSYKHFLKILQTSSSIISKEDFFPAFFISHLGLIILKYRELLHVRRKRPKVWFFKRIVYKEWNAVAITFMKWCLTLIIRNVQIKTTLRYHISPINLEKKKSKSLITHSLDKSVAREAVPYIVGGTYGANAMKVDGGAKWCNPYEGRFCNVSENYRYSYFLF